LLPYGRAVLDKLVALAVALLALVLLPIFGAVAFWISVFSDPELPL